VPPQEALDVTIGPRLVGRVEVSGNRAISADARRGWPARWAAGDEPVALAVHTTRRGLDAGQPGERAVSIGVIGTSFARKTNTQSSSLTHGILLHDQAATSCTW
jgi:hypothetical protein